MKNNVVSFAEYKKKQEAQKKNLTWLYSLSEFDLISEFIESHAKYETNTSDILRAKWLDVVSEVMSAKFFKASDAEESRIDFL